MELSELLKEQSRQYNADLKLDDSRRCSFMVNEELAVTVEDVPEENCFYIYAKVTSVPTVDKEGIYRRALKANLFGQETGDSWFALDEKHNALVLMMRIKTASADYESYSKNLEDFVSYLKLCQEKIDVEDVEATTCSSSLEENWKKL